MRRFFLLLIPLLQLGQGFADFSIYAGPHFNYTRLDFDNPTDLEGYMGGLTVYGEARHSCMYASAEFEGYWNAGPITGVPCERSSLREYYAAWKIGGYFFFPRCNFLLQPYIGGGWNQYLNEQDPRGQSLTYRYEKVCVPIGFIGTYFSDCGLSMGVQFEGRPDVYSHINFSSFEFETDFEYAFRVQLPVEMSFVCCCSIFDLQVVPFFDWNRFGEVRDSTALEEVLIAPQLTRWNLGIRAMLGFCF